MHRDWFKYLVNNEKFDFVILMDGDGEDRPEEIKYLISKATLLITHLLWQRE